MNLDLEVVDQKACMEEALTSLWPRSKGEEEEGLGS
jgi:hypothetical protein